MKKNMLRVLTLLENKLISFPVIKSAELSGGGANFGYVVFT